ncbi:hypothetical protein L195_g040271, partial [Trifolium pratense]
MMDVCCLNDRWFCVALMTHSLSPIGRLLRRLCTEATVAEIPKRKPGLYQKLAELEKTRGTMSQTLNQYIMEGKAVGKGELERDYIFSCVATRFGYILEVFLPTRIDVFIAIVEFMLTINYAYTSAALSNQ